MTLFVYENISATFTKCFEIHIFFDGLVELIFERIEEVYPSFITV